MKSYQVILATQREGEANASRNVSLNLNALATLSDFIASCIKTQVQQLPAWSRQSGISIQEMGMAQSPHLQAQDHTNALPKEE